tara:strand:- start:1191 stop:1820 length:630 start_codon:yes stop_codon:yes gene_type:complete
MSITLPKYITKGFTITQWVRFKDRVNSGTLFNYGNPVRTFDPKGYRLETFTVSRDNFTANHTFSDGTTFADNNFFIDNDYERFIRLVVYEPGNPGTLRDSHIGTDFLARTNGDVIPGDLYSTTLNSNILFTYTRVPIDFNEWYFITASYNPLIQEDDGTGYGTYGYNSDFWKGNIDLGGTYTHHSGYGARCKVEIISKSDLLRARGFRT